MENILYKEENHANCLLQAPGSPVMFDTLYSQYPANICSITTKSKDHVESAGCNPERSFRDDQETKRLHFLF